MTSRHRTAFGTAPAAPSPAASSAEIETAPVAFFNLTPVQIHQQGQTWELQVGGYVHGNYRRKADARKAAATAAAHIAACGQARIATDVLARV